MEGNWGTNDKSMWEGQIRGRSAPFLLTNPDFSKTEVVKAYAHTVVVPEIDYWKRTIEVKKGAQVERMKRVRIFNPLHVLTNKISDSQCLISKGSRYSSCLGNLRLWCRLRS